MTTTVLLTELEALNMMLTAADEAPVQTASQEGHLPLSIAKSILDDASRVVQSKGWAFNTESGTLSPGTDGRIVLPDNTLSADVADKYTDINPVLRGTVLYDRKNRTDRFTKAVEADLIVLLPWDSLPQAARWYITVRATRSFQARMQAGETPFAMTEADEQLALVALESLEADTGDANFLTDSYSVASVLFGREQ
jgi:hypothetical protein